jgi:hypothetical protein
LKLIKADEYAPLAESVIELKRMLAALFQKLKAR